MKRKLLSPLLHIIRSFWFYPFPIGAILSSLNWKERTGTPLIRNLSMGRAPECGGLIVCEEMAEPWSNSGLRGSRDCAYSIPWSGKTILKSWHVNKDFNNAKKWGMQVSEEMTFPVEEIASIKTLGQESAYVREKGLWDNFNFA